MKSQRFPLFTCLIFVGVFTTLSIIHIPGLSAEESFGTVSAPGWYYGDMHSHSIHSDGKGSVSNNVAVAKWRGLSFLATTDHNTISQKVDVERENRDGFISILGSEITATWGHATALFITQRIDWEQGPQYAIDRALDDGGLFFIVHPFDSRSPWQNWDVEGYTGIEVWNGPIVSEMRNRLAFDKWNELLNGGKKVIGITGTDAHGSGEIGVPRICAYLNELSEEGIYWAIKNGHFYGTDRPDLRFEINDMIMGSTVSIEKGSTVTIEIQAWSDSFISKVALIKNGVEIKSWHERNAKVEISFSDMPTDDSWYRVEVSDMARGFAFSNPIWVEVQ